LAKPSHTTNGAPAIADPPEPAPLRLGARLAEHRTRQGLRVSELARKVGVSASLISQMERDQSRPSVSTLFALGEALGVPVDAFFRDQHERPGDEVRTGDAGPAVPSGESKAAMSEPPGAPSDRYVVRGDERAAIDIEGGVRWERLTPTALRDLEFMELHYAPGAESNPTQYRHPGMEMLLVLAGRLEIALGFETYELRAGDSMCFASTLPHRYTNPSDQLARAVTVILPGDTASGISRSDRRT
jgi:transcriptional regulator with XRE-family HTH domain